MENVKKQNVIQHKCKNTYEISQLQKCVNHWIPYGFGSVSKFTISARILTSHTILNNPKNKYRRSDFPRFLDLF